MMRTLILQSCPPAERTGWLAPCLASVEAWAQDQGHEYRWIGETLFAELPEELRQKTREQPVIASDLARLWRLQEALAAGHPAAVWLDADVLITAAARLQLPARDCAVGRELWVQPDARGRLRCYRKVHNAFLLFRRQASGRNSSLDFYADSAERLLRATRGGMPPQFIGPKLLTALHNVVQFPVLESAGMLSPAVAEDLLAGGGPALRLFCRRADLWPAAWNLCRSRLQGGEIDMPGMQALIQRLLSLPTSPP